MEEFKSFPFLFQVNFFSVLLAIKSSANTVLHDTSVHQSHSVLHERCDLLVDVVAKIQRLLTDGNHGNDFDALMRDAMDSSSDEEIEKGLEYLILS